MKIQGEKYELTSHDKIRIAQNASLCIPATLNEMLSALKTATSLGKRQEIISCLQALIPEFTPDMRLTPLTVWPEDIEELAVVRTRPIEASAQVLVNA